jgi:hypothetical protein
VTNDPFDYEKFDETAEGAPVELSAEERAASLRVITGDAEDIYEVETQAFLFLLAAAVHKLGGSVTFTKEEREVRYALGIDQSDLDGGRGPLRLFSVPQEGQ